MPTRRALLTTVGVSAISMMAGCTGGRSTAADGTTVPPSDGPIATAPLPDQPGETRYAKMGTDGPVVTYFGNWKCPLCAEFSTGSDRVFPLTDVVTRYVQPGELRLRFRGVAYTPAGEPFLGPDAPRATRAGLAVWTTAPETYWRYHEYVMANQPPESQEWATTDRLVRFAEAAGVPDTTPVRKAAEGTRFSNRVAATTERFARSEAEGTPTLIIDGDPVSPFEPETMRTALDAVTG